MRGYSRAGEHKGHFRRIRWGQIFILVPLRGFLRMAGQIVLCVHARILPFGGLQLPGGARTDPSSPNSPGNKNVVGQKCPEDAH